MRYANIVYNDIVNSNGVALTFYCQGCKHHCKGCFNTSTWDFKGGKELTCNIIDNALNVVKMFPSGYDNLVLLGGEPFQNIDTCLAIVIKFKKLFPNKNIWCYTGYAWKELIQDKEKINLLQYIDILIDGKFIEELRDLNLKFRGSSNQRLINVDESLKQNKIILVDKYMEV